jgi:hypothetical protein
VITSIPEHNAAVVDVWGTPLVGLLPERWPAGDIAPGTRLGLDVKAGAQFQPESA